MTIAMVDDAMLISSINNDNGLAEVLTNGVYGQILRAFSKLELGDDSTLQLPKIVVVGDESVGKSSTIERIAEYKIFPTGEGFTTRMVTKLMLRHTDAKEEVIIRIVHRKSGQVVTDENGDQFEACVPIGDDYRKETEDLIREQISKNIDKFTARSENDTDVQDVDTDHEFQVEVRSVRVATLNLYDMPGIVSDPPAIAENTRKLTRDQMNDPNVVVICVLSMTTNLRNSIVLTEIREANKVRGPKMRAIGVLTHVDMSTPVRVEKSIKTFLPDSPLNSFIPMINMDSNPINGYRTDFAEEDYTDAGVSTLVRQLDVQLRSYMREYWLQNQLDKLKTYHNVVEKDILALGAVANSETIKREIATDVQRVLISHFQTKLSELLISSEQFLGCFEVTPGMPDITKKPFGRIDRIKFMIYWKQKISESFDVLSHSVVQKASAFITSTALMPILSTCQPALAIQRFSGLSIFLPTLLSDLFKQEWSIDKSVLKGAKALIDKYISQGGLTLPVFLVALTDLILEYFLVPVLMWCEGDKFVSTLLKSQVVWKDDNDGKRKELESKLTHIANAQNVMRSLEE